MERPSAGLTSRPERHNGRRFGRVARTTLPQEIVKALVQQLREGGLRAGDALPSERDLCEQLGVGRTSVREALKALTLVGIVEVRPGGGTYIANPDSTPLVQPLAWRMLLSPMRVLEAVQARVLIEGELAAEAARRGDQAAIEEIGRQAAVMRETAEAPVFDAARYLDADVAFHLAVARAAQNSVLQEILVALRSLLQSFIERSLELEGREAALVANPHHAAIHAAIARGDVEEARGAMVHHIRTKGLRLVDALRAEPVAVGGAAGGQPMTP